MTPYAALLDRTREDPASPLLTYRDLASGERMELSAASLANAVAKTAGLLRDELSAVPGTIVGVHLPLHWQRAVWLGACAATGAVFAAEADPRECDVCVVDRARITLLGTAPEDVLVSLAPFGLPEPEGAPPGVVDAAVAMRAHPDTFVPYDVPQGSSPLMATSTTQLSQDEVMDLARAELARRDIAPGTRFAITDDDPQADLLSLAGPLVGRSSVLLIVDPPSGELAGVLREEGAVLAAG